MSFTAHIPNLALPDILQVVCNRGLSGFTNIVSGAVSAKLVMKTGRVVYASSDTTSRLGFTLVEKRVITEEGLERALRLQFEREDNMPLASCLLKLGLVFPEVLEQETRDHIVNVFADVLGWPNGQVYFEEQQIEDTMTVLKDGLALEWVLIEATKRQHVQARVDREIWDAFWPGAWNIEEAGAET